jgi:hypothetical protein
MELPAKGAHWLLVNPMKARTSFEFDRISACISLSMAEKSSAALQRGCPVGLQTRRPPRNPQSFIFLACCEKCLLAPEPGSFRSHELPFFYIAPPSSQNANPGTSIQCKRFKFKEIAFPAGYEIVNRNPGSEPFWGIFSSFFAQICAIFAYSSPARFQPQNPKYLLPYLRLVG